MPHLAPAPPCAGDAAGPWVHAISVRLWDTGRVVRVTRSVAHQWYHHQHACSKRTFPLLLAYAMTAHRCQGATLSGTTILHVRHAFAPTIVYVMLSRATTRANLYVLDGLAPQDFAPIDDAAFERTQPGPTRPASGSGGSSDTSEPADPEP